MSRNDGPSWHVETDEQGGFAVNTGGELVTGQAASHTPFIEYDKHGAMTAVGIILVLPDGSDRRIVLRPVEQEHYGHAKIETEVDGVQQDGYYFESEVDAERIRDERAADSYERGE